MKITYEHIIIAILSIALLYYIVNHYSLLGDLFKVDDTNHPQLKALKSKHGYGLVCCSEKNDRSDFVRRHHDRELCDLTC
jgi:hypothetical protein